jgi:ABC-type bacteriocin/lantibiotic exporter with double-glycine peptidase domain
LVVKRFFYTHYFFLRYADILFAVCKIFQQYNNIIIKPFIQRAKCKYSNSNKGEGAAFPGLAPEIKFKNFSFSYPGSGSRTLCDISFTIKKGERVAVVGRNGAGKTTLVKLLTGLYRATDSPTADIYTRIDFIHRKN